MGIHPEFLVEQHRVEIDPTVLPDKMFCMDDRMNLDGLMGWQHPGGPDGLGRDVATAMEYQEPGSFVNLGIPIHHTGTLIAKRLRMLNVEALMHPDCAAHESAQVIRSTMHEEADLVKIQTEMIGYPIDAEDEERLAEASWRIDQSGLILPTHETIRDWRDGIEEIEIPPTKHLTLVPTPHVSSDIIVDMTGEAVWDTASAHEAGNDAYYIGLGTLARAHARLENIVPVKLDPLLKSAVWRLGAISLRLPQPDNVPLRLHTIGDPVEMSERAAA